ncbi:Serine/threonine-protein kinase Nek1 (Never in mitosis A-related kinase 1) (NimA-related protein kinase 1), partial [Durusdinium trenchii]
PPLPKFPTARDVVPDVDRWLMLEERYERLQILGEGSYGTAHLVRERHGSRKYVAKEIRISHLGEKERSLALAEADVLKRLAHANIIRYVDSFIEARLLYIIMEYADHGDLATQIQLRRGELGTPGSREGPFTESEIMRVHLQLLLALSHIHGQKILHRDLKPLNIFLTRQWIVKLGDFGISKVLESTTLGAQTTIGTPLYLAPEICSGEPYGLSEHFGRSGLASIVLITEVGHTSILSPDADVQVARLARERCRGDSVPRTAAAPAAPVVSPRRSASAERPAPSAPSAPADRREEVKRKSREQREATEAARLKELEEARVQAFQERLAAKQRMEHDRSSHLGPATEPRERSRSPRPPPLVSEPERPEAETSDLKALRFLLEEALE